MADFYSLRDAMYVTLFPVARQVPVELGGRRDGGDDEVQDDHRRHRANCLRSTQERRQDQRGLVVPGQVIQPAADPKIVEVVTRLRIMIKQPRCPRTSGTNHNASMGTYGMDPLVKKVAIMLGDLARDLWDTAINGRFIDTASIVAGGGLTAANILATGSTISPARNNDPQRGQGAIEFSYARKALRFKSPGDNDFGDWVPFTPG